MFSGHLNIFGLSWFFASATLFLWYLRIKRYSPESEMKQVWMRFTRGAALFVIFLGASFFWENSVWIRANLIVAHFFMIPALLAVSEAWWMLLGRAMPRWWKYSILTAMLVYVGLEIFFAFKGYLSYAVTAKDSISVIIRNDHPIVTWLFIPAAWTSTMPFGFLLWKKAFGVPGVNAKLRMIFMGTAWMLGSAGAVLSGLTTDPARLFSSSVINTAIYVIAALVLLAKKPPAVSTISQLSEKIGPSTSSPAP